MDVVTQFPAIRYERTRHFQAMFEGAAVGIAICQLNGQILEANPALSKMLGYSSPELEGARVGEFHPGEGAEIGPDLDDSNFLSEHSSSDHLSPEHRFLDELMRGERESVETEKRYRRKDGSEFWGHLTMSLGRGGGHQAAFLIAMLADATERKQVEEHLREAEKMEVIGRLAGGIAHDFNNLLTGILLYCDLLSAALENPHLENIGLERSLLCQHVEEVRMAGEQGAALTQQLLAIARKQAAEPHPILINEIVASTENLLRRLIGEQVELVSELDSDAGLVLADAAQLRQILMNLVLNARDAMPQGGTIRLSTRVVELPGEVEPARQRRAVSLKVQDNGCGMDARTRRRLFEPFFTTKNPGKGTGLGLATVQRIVSEANGKIEVESEPGRGTCIEVFLPGIDASPDRSVPPSGTLVDAAVHESRGKTILLADDHATTRRSMQHILRDAGYRILPASGGKQALKVFAERSGGVDLLIANCTMPGMNGQELAEALLRQQPGLKVLLISGYQQALVRTSAGVLKFMRKPFSGKTLLERVVETMESP
ncbi:MAG: PAS domain S-box protein [Acidobacteriia bacterium]|nr:PAS domain S-box protein [Terriglobia bacterium]